MAIFEQSGTYRPVKCFSCRRESTQQAGNPSTALKCSQPSAHGSGRAVASKMPVPWLATTIAGGLRPFRSEAHLRSLSATARRDG